MGLFSSSLEISGYKTSDFSVVDFIGKYRLQLNPSEISINVGQKEDSKTSDSEANGSEISSRAPIFLQRTLDFNFIIDNTGAVPNKPDGMGLFGDLIDSINSLEEITVNPVASTHRPPFVRVSWGLGNISFFGIVTTFKYNYTFFNAYGTPLRANITMQVQDFDNEGVSLFQSPDITKMPLIIEGDNIVKLSEKYYDDKNYYIKLADFNNLSSLRAIKNGTLLEIPPIK